jgi:hypothetical protein
MAEDSVKEATEKVLGYKTKVNHKEWYNEECKIAINIRNDKRTRMLQRTTTTIIEDCRTARREEHNICCKRGRTMKNK